MQHIPAVLLDGMLGEPLAHPVVGPIPLQGMRVQTVILRPRVLHMRQKLLPATPGTTLQITPAEGPDEQLRLIQPGSMDRRKAGSPPVSMRREVLVRRGGGVAGVAVLNQTAAGQMPMATAKILQRL